MTDFFPKHLTQLATTVLTALREKGLKVVTAESCTGGLIAGALTEISGSSSVVDRGFVTYSNEAKMQMLGVLQQTLADSGAVSDDTASEMALGALKHSDADIAVSATGIAGPSGGSDAKPVGLVYIGISSTNGTSAVKNIFDGDRTDIRLSTIEKALQMILDEVKSL